MEQSSQQKWFITGASGFIGRHVIADLIKAGHIICGLSRQNLEKLPQSGVIWVQNCADCPFEPSHVLNLAGEPIADKPWSKDRKKVLRDSRIKVTEEMSAWLRTCEKAPKLIIQASAIGYYGTTSPAKTEASDKGHGFAAELCADWEAALQIPKAQRIVTLRIGVVLGADGGMIKKLYPIFKLGLGGKIGTGDQMLSWVSLEDLGRIIHFVTENTEISGIINATAPNPMNNQRFAQHFAKSLHRPALIPTPAFMMRAIFGTMAEELLLSGQIVLPQKLLDQGFEFHHPWVCRALSAALGKGQ